MNPGAGGIPKYDMPYMGTGSKGRHSPNHPQQDKMRAEMFRTLPTHPTYDSDWEAREELRMRELEEARARAAQMEKTMRWWSDCTANWREKWSKVRTERNKAREEVRQLRSKFDFSVKEANIIKREKQELYIELEKLRKSLQQHVNEKEAASGASSTGSGKSMPAERDVNIEDLDVSEKTPEKESVVDSGVSEANRDLDFLDKLLMSNSLSANADQKEKIDAKKSSPELHVDEDMPTGDDEECYPKQKLMMLQLRLDEAAKTIQGERLEKAQLMKSIEKLQSEFLALRTKYEDVKKAKQEAIKELTILKAEHQDELESIRSDMQDEANSRSSMDRRLADLRKELENLQAENAAEWGKRERLETEKIALERETKKLRAQIEDLERNMEKKHKQTSVTIDTDLKTLQSDLYEKNKELGELKHSNSKMKKLLQDKSTELVHATRRAEQYESEVKKLRCRVEELKKELASAEDEVDCQSNNIRKLQRTNDELQEQVDSLQVQVEHLQTRSQEADVMVSVEELDDTTKLDFVSETETKEIKSTGV